MKIIEAMKEIKNLLRKVDDLKAKITTHTADLDNQEPAYADQAAQLKEWMQGHHDTVLRIAQLREAIQRTNLVTSVTITLPSGLVVSHSLAGWLIRRLALVQKETELYSAIGDRGLQNNAVRDKEGDVIVVRLRRYYDPKERDKKLEDLKSEPHLIDAALEMANATTELIGA